jgi:hypothetical protein
MKRLSKEIDSQQAKTKILKNEAEELKRDFKYKSEKIINDLQAVTLRFRNVIRLSV